MYTPPFDINDEMIALISSIMERLGTLKYFDNFKRVPELRKVSNIKSICASLAIENNQLNVDEVRDVINGLEVIGNKKDITEVKNAMKAYELLDQIDPYELDSLLKIHEIMMHSLVEDAGKLRNKEVGVYNELGDVVHMAPPHHIAKEKLYELFEWLNNSKTHILIKSSVFYYEFEFIHPFMDGNGRMGRFWQSALLTHWKKTFSLIPIESVIKERQDEYYHAIMFSTKNGNCNAFIIFMLRCIDEAIKDLLKDVKSYVEHLSDQIRDLLKVIKTYPKSAKELMKDLGLKSRLTFMRHYLNPALELGLIKLTNPEAKTSKNQKYYKP